ncbi:hypothetical protein A1F94_008024 [Pyrenophora tritici-repentis]|uniref:Uncharacterized protein n=2 Tax=Pyrenophora tritici-repentis TaxID=45151 RepID=A0A2W1EJ54_9PLEO|nr:hypothetical protein A1F94_008024 [Pyrenophora tritici-repentis]KAI0575168.1 hypothetical protein Alg130_09362 [Pyrenophora tritici-repentis]KAI0578241.1 hypothetical protein Alg215_06433 [Pyrenophora tritici-repentis]KAI0606419.1 hypothetical protein TUN205_09324 [Pyrenophora tritici-repentis]KAI0618586.1 hypothetical protein TUN199_09411 [Pyrenophora tritici-repentis]
MAITVFNDTPWAKEPADLLLYHTSGGSKTEYHAHSAMLRSRSQWFDKVLHLQDRPAAVDDITTIIRHGPITTIEVFGSTIETFDLLLKIMYLADNNTAGAAAPATGNPAAALNTLVNVWDLAYRYEIEELHVDVAKKMGLLPADDFKFPLSIHTWHKMLQKYYSNFPGGANSLGREMAVYFLRNEYGEYLKSILFDTLVEEHPELAVDLFWAARSTNDGKLW